MNKQNHPQNYMMMKRKNNHYILQLYYYKSKIAAFNSFQKNNPSEISVNQDIAINSQVS